MCLSAKHRRPIVYRCGRCGNIELQHDCPPDTAMPTFLRPQENAPPWANDCLSTLGSRIDDESYPCFYARSARLVARFVEVPIEQAAPLIGRFIEEYLQLIGSINNLRERAYVLLVVFFPPTTAPAPMTDYWQGFWGAVGELLDGDPCEWPSSIPFDPETPNWSFCFGGVPIFINVNTPAHHRRRSRNLGRSLTLIFQPREGLDLVSPPDWRGDGIRTEIRARITNYDSLPASPDLASYGSPSNRDWRLYFLPDNEEGFRTECPLTSRSKS